MKHILPTNLRRPEERYAALKMADALLRADRKRQQRMAINDEFGGTVPSPIKKREGAFDVLKRHPLYNRTPRTGAFRRGRAPKEI